MKTYKEMISEVAKVVGKIHLSRLPSNRSEPSQSSFVTRSDINNLEKILDNLFKSVNIDIEFTRHFLDRVNDTRNKKQISIAELQSLFTKTYQKYSKELQQIGGTKDFQAVLNDIQTKINVPFVLKWNKRSNMIELISKTVMRKPNFKTTNAKLKV